MEKQKKRKIIHSESNSLWNYTLSPGFIIYFFSFHKSFSYIYLFYFQLKKRLDSRRSDYFKKSVVKIWNWKMKKN